MHEKDNEKQNAPPKSPNKAYDGEKNGEFIAKTSNLIDLSITLAEEMLSDAISKMREGEKSSIPLNQLSSFIGTLFDKRAQVKNDNGVNRSVTISLPKEAKKYAK